MYDFSGRSRPSKVRANRRKREKKPVNLRRLLHRLLRYGVTLFSVVMVVVGGFFMVQMVMSSDQFRIDTIRVEGNQRLCEKTVTALSDIKPGVSTFSLDLHLIGRKIEHNPWIHQARVTRIFPRQVVISVVERKPVAIVNLGYLYYLDGNGDIFKVLGSTDDLDFPVITGFDPERLENHDVRDRRSLKDMVELIEDLSRREQFHLGRVSEIHREKGGGLSVYSIEGVRIRLGYDNYAAKLDRLERLYARLKPKIRMLDYIDLNVDEKVIVRIERSSEKPRI